MRADALWQWLHRFKATRWGFAALMVPNLVGIVFGYYYYWQVGQFDPSSPHFEHPVLWPLVADSPNAVLLMSLSLVLYRFGRRSAILDSLAFVAMVYIGLWTTFVFVAYPSQFGTWDWGATNNRLFLSHLLMPLEALVLVRDLRRDALPRWFAVALAIATAVHLGVDHGPMQARPAPFLDAGPAIWVGSLLLAAVSLAAWVAVVWPGLRSRRGEDAAG